MLADFRAVVGHSLCLEQKKKWYGTYEGMPSGSWNRTAEKMLLNLAGSGHPILCCTRAPGERTIKKQKRRKDNYTFHSR